MMVRNKRLWIVPTLLAVALATTLVFAKPSGDTATAIALKPSVDQADAAQMAMKILTRMHYKPEAFDTKMSQQVFDRYLDSLDADRLFFTQADVDRFTPARDTLGDAILNKDLSVPFAIFNLYIERIS